MVITRLAQRMATLPQLSGGRNGAKSMLSAARIVARKKARNTSACTLGGARRYEMHATITPWSAQVRPTVGAPRHSLPGHQFSGPRHD